MRKYFIRRTWVKGCFALLCVVVVLAIALILGRDGIARAVWQQYQFPIVALKLDQADADLAMQIGSYYFGSGAYDLDRGDAAFSKAIALEPGILWGHYQLARIAFVKGNFTEALSEINTELKYNPENLRSLYIRGLIYAYSGRLELAEADFRRFTEWAPSEWAGYNDLAWVLAKESKFADAEKSIEEGMQRVSDAEHNPWLWNSLGVAELNLEKFVSAKNSFEEAKTSAALLTADDWHKSDPGNDPQFAENGLEQFRDSIEANLKKAEEGIKSN